MYSLLDIGDYTKVQYLAKRSLALVETIRWKGMDATGNWQNRLRTRRSPR